jgi:hypothetical protein
MAIFRVSFLLGGERFHGRLNRCSVLSDVPAKATRVNRAGPGYKVIRLRRLSHILPKDQRIAVANLIRDKADLLESWE